MINQYIISVRLQLSIIPHANEVGGLSFKLTESGMVLHFVAYFIAAALLYLAYRKNTLFSILISCFSIFMFSVALEFIQIYLPYRTFNPMDIVANGVGIVVFVLAWIVFWRRRPEMALFLGDE